MVNSKQAWDYFGDPNKETSLCVWYVPKDLIIGAIPKKIYCNKLLVRPLELAFTELKKQKLVIEEWNGCFVNRPIRGYEKQYELTKNPRYLSLHSWGLAVDINASTNKLGTIGTIDKKIVKAFKSAGFDWGGDFKDRKDPMHFQLKSWKI